MMRLPLRELEEALSDPTEYRKKVVERGGGSSPMRASFFNALRDSVFKYHQSGKEKSLEYLLGRISTFKSDSRKKEVIDQLAWYVESFVSSGFVCVGTRMRIDISANATLEFFGEVSRIDMDLSKGYAAWLLQKRKTGNWKTELRMPLIQHAVARMYGVTSQYVTVGAYFFDDMQVERYSFSEGEIASALARLGTLAGELNI